MLLFSLCLYPCVHFSFPSVVNIIYVTTTANIQKIRSIRGLTIYPKNLGFPKTWVPGKFHGLYHDLENFPGRHLWLVWRMVHNHVIIGKYCLQTTFRGNFQVVILSVELKSHFRKKWLFRWEFDFWGIWLSPWCDRAFWRRLWRKKYVLLPATPGVISG